MKESDQKSFLYKLGPAILWALFIICLTSLPGPSVPKPKLLPPGTDKVVHLLIFLNLGRLVCKSLWPKDLTMTNKLVLAFGSLTFVTEIIQYFIPGRTMDLLDFISNACGYLLGCAFILKKSSK